MDGRDRHRDHAPDRLQRDLADPAGSHAGRLPGDRRRHRPARDQRDPRRLGGRRLPDSNLGKTAIAFDVAGLDQPTPVHVYVYIFRDRATYERLRTAVDDCARSYVTDPQTYESVETSPFVIAGQGPWGPQLKDNLRAALVEAAGTGE